MPIATGKADGKGKTVGLLFDVTGRGDKSFNDGAAAGLDKAKEDFGITGNESTPTAATVATVPSASSMVGRGSALIVAVGFLWDTAVTPSATANPDQKYTIIDARVVDAAGDAAAQRALERVRRQGELVPRRRRRRLRQQDRQDRLHRRRRERPDQAFEAGFEAGAKAVNPTATVEVKYITQPPDFTGFNDPAKGKAIAEAMYDGGIDVVYPAAGGSGKGVFEAAKRPARRRRHLRHRRRLRPVPDGRPPTSSRTSSPRR